VLLRRHRCVCVVELVDEPPCSGRCVRHGPISPLTTALCVCVGFSQPLTLFRGMSMPLATIPVVNAVVFWAYGDAKRYMETTQKRSELPISHLAACGAYAGLVNCAVVSPTELVKIQLQAQAADAKTWSAAGGQYYNGPLQWFKDAFRLNGWRAGFQGMVPSILRELPAYAGQFFMYEVSAAACMRGLGFRGILTRGLPCPGLPACHGQVPGGSGGEQSYKCSVSSGTRQCAGTPGGPRRHHGGGSTVGGRFVRDYRLDSVVPPGYHQNPRAVLPPWACTATVGPTPQVAP
jgi:hypothetical protein